MTSPHPAKPIRIAIIGIAEMLPNGSLSRSGALAIALAAHAQVSVTLRAMARDADTVGAIDAILCKHHVTSQVRPRPDGDASPIRLGDTLDIWGLFAHDVVIFDADDAPLRAWLTDLPAHTAPGVRILGTLDYVTESGDRREQDIALRFDAMVGTVEQSQNLFDLQDTHDAADLAGAIGRKMRGVNLRAAAIHDGSTFAITALDEPAVMIPLSPGIPREDLIAAVAIAMAQRAPWPSVSDLLQP